MRSLPVDSSGCTLVGVKEIRDHSYCTVVAEAERHNLAEEDCRTPEVLDYRILEG